jgi:sugar phosphate isomerase/epimerase
MKLAGHTMGVPNLNLYQSMVTFKQIGFTGIEIRCAKDGQLDTTTADTPLLEQVLQWKQEIGIDIVCLTSYFKDFITEAKDTELANLKRVIEIAHVLGCPLVRVYGGIDPVPEGYTRKQGWDKTVSGIQEAADYALLLGIRLCIETHIGSLSLTVIDTVRMVQDINRLNTGILLDFAWVYYAGKETIKEAIDLCSPYLFHCHYKDWVFENGNKEQRRACLMGKGDIPWSNIFHELKNKSYHGYATDEYEKYWHNELPDALKGMKSNLQYVTELIY